MTNTFLSSLFFDALDSWFSQDYSEIGHNGYDRHDAISTEAGHWPNSETWQWAIEEQGIALRTLIEMQTAGLITLDGKNRMTKRDEQRGDFTKDERTATLTHDGICAWQREYERRNASAKPTTTKPNALQRFDDDSRRVISTLDAFEQDVQAQLVALREQRERLSQLRANVEDTNVEIAGLAADSLVNLVEKIERECDEQVSAIRTLAHDLKRT